MQLVYAQQPLPTEVRRSVFLAGPTPRDPAVPSWRPRALALLRERGFDGTVFVPEFEEGPLAGDYDAQVAWEEAALSAADVVLFWLPRALATLPGFTTNDEWGHWKSSGRAVFGAPDDAEKVRYQRWWAEHLGVPAATTLEQTVELALARLGPSLPSDLRVGAEAQVPLQVWRTREFQRWLATQRSAGNTLERARVRFAMYTGPRRDWLFAWVLSVSVFVAAEGRRKGGEALVSRTDHAATLLYRRGPSLRATRVLLVREFRAAATAPDAMVHELPGGSSPRTLEPLEVALQELHEEAAFEPAAGRALRSYGGRAVLATLGANHGHLFAYELDEGEFAALEARAATGEPLGEAGCSERTYLELRTVGELLDEPLVDWSTLGMVLRVLAPLFEGGAAAG